MKKIKNRTVRKALRVIANWDNCPADYQRNFRAEFLRNLGCFAITFVCMAFFSIFFLICA